MSATVFEQDAFVQDIVPINEEVTGQISAHTGMSLREIPRSLGNLSLAYFRNLPHIPAITKEMFSDRIESPEFNAAIGQHLEVGSSEIDGISRRAWFIPARNGIADRPETIVMLPGLTVQHHTGLGRENLWEFHQQLPDFNLLAIGSEGLESSIPPLEWYKKTTFEDQAKGRLEFLDKIKDTFPNIFLDEYYIVGESMGTVMGFLMAASAVDYDQRVKEIIAIAPAGIEEAGLFELGRKFALPEAIDLIGRISSTPVNRVGYYLRTLLGTANINPAALPAMVKHVQLLSSKPAPLEGIGECLPDDLAVKIIAGDCDFVANPKAFYAKLGRMHGNSSLHVYSGEHHMSLTRSHKMAKRAAAIMMEDPRTGLRVEVHKPVGRILR
ncbi:MAG TPA: hypothetical protein VIH90_03470 [Candidatus Saccharimonadales bacterium]